MPTVTKAAALLICLALTAGCSGSTPDDRSRPPADTEKGVAADGSSASLTGMSALELWAESKANADVAKSVHVAARYRDGRTRIATNLKMTDTGKVFGTVTFDGDKVRLRRLGRTLYLRAGKQFWTRNGGAAAASVRADRWVRVKQGSSTALERFFTLTDMDLVVSELMSLSAAEQAALKLVPGIDIGTRRTIGLADELTTDDSEPQKLYVSATAPAMPLNFVVGSGATRYMKFRSWNKGFDVVAPRGAINLTR
jgi:hypothetical protein